MLGACFGTRSKEEKVYVEKGRYFSDPYQQGVDGQYNWLLSKQLEPTEDLSEMAAWIRRILLITETSPVGQVAGPQQGLLRSILKETFLGLSQIKELHLFDQGPYRSRSSRRTPTLWQQE